MSELRPELKSLVSQFGVPSTYHPFLPGVGDAPTAAGGDRAPFGMQVVFMSGFLAYSICYKKNSGTEASRRACLEDEEFGQEKQQP